MNIVVTKLGDVVVDDVGNTRDVDATADDIGRHQHANAALAEFPHHSVADALGEIAVNTGHAAGLPPSPPQEPLVDLVGAAFRPTKHDRLPGVLVFKQSLEQGKFAGRLNGEIRLLDRFHRNLIG